MAKILVVDDEMGIRELLCEILEDENHEVLVAPHAAAARNIYSQTDLDLVLLDIWMPDIDGMTLLREWVSLAPLRCPVVMMSGHASIDTALEANELGAAGFLEKPITLQRLLSTVHKIISRSSLLAPSQIAASVGMESSAATATEKMIDVPVKVTSFDTIGAARSATTTTVVAISSSSSANLSNWQLAMAHIQLQTPFREFREASERVYFESLLDQTHNSMTRVSEVSGLERTHLYRKLKQLGIDVKRIKKLAR